MTDSRPGNRRSRLSRYSVRIDSTSGSNGTVRSELLSLTIQSIDGAEGDRVIGVRGKGNKERTVPLEPEVEAIIGRYQETYVRQDGRWLFRTLLVKVEERGV